MYWSWGSKPCVIEPNVVSHVSMTYDWDVILTYTNTGKSWLSSDSFSGPNEWFSSVSVKWPSGGIAWSLCWHLLCSFSSALFIPSWQKYSNIVSRHQSILVLGSCDQWSRAKWYMASAYSDNIDRFEQWSFHIFSKSSESINNKVYILNIKINTLQIYFEISFELNKY